MKKSHSYEILIILLISLLSLYLNFSKFYPDSPTWIDTAIKINQGNLSGNLEELRRLSMPVVPFLASTLKQFFELPMAFGVINSALVIATSLLIFIYGGILGLGKQETFYAALLYSTSPTIMFYGSSVLVDPAVFFFMLVFLLLFLNFQKTPSKMKLVLLLIVGGLGILTKLNFIIAPFSMLAFSLFKRDFDPKKIFICIFPAIVFLAWLAFLGLPLSYPFSSAAYSAPDQGAVSTFSRFILIIRSFFSSLGVLPIFALFGLFDKNYDWSKFWLLVGILLIVIWPVPTGRYTFMLFPAMLAASLKGFPNIKKILGVEIYPMLPYGIMLLNFFISLILIKV